MKSITRSLSYSPGRSSKSDAKALFVAVLRVGTWRAADIDRVRRTAGSNQPVAREDRANHGDIIEMPGTDPGIVRHAMSPGRSVSAGNFASTASSVRGKAP